MKVYLFHKIDDICINKLILIKASLLCLCPEFF